MRPHEFPIAACRPRVLQPRILGRGHLDDILLPSAGPTEIEARLRLLAGRRRAISDPDSGATVSLGELRLDETTYSVLLRGRPLHLTFREFALLKHLIEHPGRVFTRQQLLHSIWGYDFFGGSCTVDVHIRRLQAKLGTDHQSLISTVRNVGYMAARPRRSKAVIDKTKPALKKLAMEP